MAMILDIADGVVSELNNAALSLEFTAERRFTPSFKPSEIEDLRVSVVPRGLEITSGTRSEDQHDYQVDVGVQKKYEERDAVELDPLMDLVEEMADHFRGLLLETDPRSSCVAVENGPVFAQEHMREGRLFTSILTLTFRTWR